MGFRKSGVLRICADIQTYSLEIFIMQTENEIFKPVPDYEQYEVSQFGNIRRKLKSGRYRDLRPVLKSNGYRSVKLSQNGEVKELYLHQIVLLTWVGPCPEGFESCHGPRGASCNELSNLSYNSHLANIRDKKRDGTQPTGSACPTAKLTEEEVRLIRKLREEHSYTYKRLSQIFNVAHPTISMIINRKSWRLV